MVKKTILPKWLLDKGLDEMYGWTHTKEDLREQIKFCENKLKRLKDPKKIHAEKTFIKLHKRDIKKFKTRYYPAEDVEKAFKELIDEDENQLVFRPNPKDKGKKNFMCQKCDKTWFTKTKPKQCSKCGSKKIEQYYRLR